MPDSHQKKCRDKTAKLNVFENKSEASDAADREWFRNERKLIAYHCPWCGKYHIGRPMRK